MGKKYVTDKVFFFILFVGFKGGEEQCEDVGAQQRSGTWERLRCVALTQAEEEKQVQCPFKENSVLDDLELVINMQG